MTQVFKLAAALALLTGVLAKTDGQGNDDWMFPSPEQVFLRSCLEGLIEVLM